MKFQAGDKVRKISGGKWRGTVVGTYSTELTPEGYAVESSTEAGSVQIYPAKALEAWDGEAEGYTAVDMATARAEGFRDGQAAVQLALAQDEQQPLIYINPMVVDELEGKRKPSLGGLTWSRKACAHWTLPLYTRPAQAEQQPAVAPDWLSSYEAMGDRLLAAGWRPETDSQWDGLRRMHSEYAAPIAQTAPQGTTSDQYRAELYDEVWEKARSMGYVNATDALAELERMKAAPQAVTLPAYRRTPDQSTYRLKADWQNQSLIDVGFNTALDEVTRLNAPQPEQSEWIGVKDRLPEPGCHVLAFYLNSFSKGRRIRAEYVAPKSREMDDCSDPDTECVEYDEETDSFYLTAGWYELMDNWDEYSSIAVVEGVITHWMPLPDAPALSAQGGE